MITASDSTSWLHCQGRIWLDKFQPVGEAVELSEFDKLIIRMGELHEWNIKRDLARKYQLVEAVSEEHTRALMEAGTQIIYQGLLSEGDIIGKSATSLMVISSGFATQKSLVFALMPMKIEKSENYSS